MTAQEDTERRARKAAEREMRAQNVARLTPSDVAIASFPRSGNTWIRLCLLDLFHQMEGRVTTPDMIKSINRVIPSLRKTDIRETTMFIGKTRLYKTHINSEIGERRFVYIIRNPIDCLRSYHRFITKGRLEDAESLESFVGRTLSSWITHVTEALELAAKEPNRACIVSYEKMHRSPQETLWRVSRFLDLPLALSHIARAVENNQIEHSRARAERRGASNVAWNYGEGKVGLGAEMPVALVDEIKRETQATYERAKNAAKPSLSERLAFRLDQLR